MSYILYVIPWIYPFVSIPTPDGNKGVQPKIFNLSKLCSDAPSIVAL